MFQSKMFQQNGTLVTVVDGVSYTVDNEHPNYEILYKAFRENDSETFVANVDFKESLQSAFASTGVEVRDDGVYYNGEQLHYLICETILRMKREGCDVAPMVKFLENLMQNPSARAVNEGYRFLEICGLTITEDGYFLAYKTVSENYMDKYSGTYSNKPGAEIKMPRNQVDDNPNNTCGRGLHVGALKYAGPGGWYNSSGDKVVYVKVNPRDIVCVPIDHSFQKMRVCRYEVVGDFKGAYQRVVYSGKVGDDYSSKPEENRFVIRNLDPEDMTVDEYYTFDCEGVEECGLVLDKSNGWIEFEFPDGEIGRYSYSDLNNVQVADESTFDNWEPEEEEEEEDEYWNYN